MATREYIGARYVPKFYNNPNGGAEWIDNVTYESLTIVTYGGNSFTSKRAVPSNIGNPSDNPTYWASTGNYNAQVEEYRQEVIDFKNSLSEDIEDIESKLADVSIEFFRNKSICIIGDSISYNGTYPPNWAEQFRVKVSSVGATVINKSNDGMSFAGWANDNDLLASIPVCDIYIVFLGINDFQGQFPWTGGITAFDTPACASKVLRAVIDKNKNADYYYISPIKVFLSFLQ